MHGFQNVLTRTGGDSEGDKSTAKPTDIIDNIAKNKRAINNYEETLIELKKKLKSFLFLSTIACTFAA